MKDHTMIDLLQFCNPDRPKIAKPWSEGNMTCAVDGRLLICVPRRDDVPERDDAPNAAEILKSPPVAHWYAMPPVKDWPHKLRSCEDCDGTGHQFKTCKVCKGTGTTPCGECGSERDCSNCGGKGYAPDTDTICSDCKGAKKIPHYADMITPAGALGFETLAKLALLSGVQLGVLAEVNHAAIPFEADGCHGMAMIVKGFEDEVEEKYAAFVAYRRET
jgi:hypothetical protein